jgi:hypothetical protein
VHYLSLDRDCRFVSEEVINLAQSKEAQQVVNDSSLLSDLQVNSRALTAGGKTIVLETGQQYPLGSNSKMLDSGSDLAISVQKHSIICE